MMSREHFVVHQPCQYNHVRPERKESNMQRSTVNEGKALVSLTNSSGLGDQ